MKQTAVSGLAAVADGAGRFEIAEIETPAPAPGEVRVRIQACGLCHTDHASLTWPGPLVLGHEGAGIVDVVGAGVAGVRAGDRVLLNWAMPCGHCFQCDAGLPPLYGNCLPERDFPKIFDWVRSGELSLDALISRTYRLEELGTAIDDMLSGRIAKGVIELDRSL